MRVTADSNIYVSGILFGGKPLTLPKLGHARRIRLFISDDIIDETLGVLREKFKRLRESITVAEEFIRVCTYEVAPTAAVRDDELVCSLAASVV